MRWCVACWLFVCGLVGGFLILFCCVFVGFWFACLACLGGWQVAPAVVWNLVFWCSLAILANFGGFFADWLSGFFCWVGCCGGGFDL